MGGDHSEPVSPDALGQLEVLRHDCHALGVDRAQVGVLEQRNEVGLSSLLQGQHCLALEPHLLLVFGGDLAHQPLEGQLANEQVGLSGGRGTLFWNLRISRSATVPGLKRWGFLRPEGMGALLRAIF